MPATARTCKRIGSPRNPPILRRALYREAERGSAKEVAAYPHLLVAEEGIEELPERLPHLLASGWARCAPDRSLLRPRSNRICEAAAREGAGATRGRGPWREARRPGWKVLEGPDGGRAG